MLPDIQLFCNVDEEGNIIDAYYGENIIASEPYDFFFFVNVQTDAVPDITKYKVVIEGFKAQLVKKEGEV